LRVSSRRSCSGPYAQPGISNLHQTLIIPESNETNLVVLASADKGNFISFPFTLTQPSVGQAGVDEIFFLYTIRPHIIGTCGAAVDKIVCQR
jgi:hypothetical protein